jgi:hypothetical protein
MRGTPVILTLRGRRYAVPPRVSVEFVGEGDEPDVTLQCAMTDGVPTVREIRITAKPDGKQIRDAHLDELALSRMARRAFAEFASLVMVQSEQQLTVESPLTGPQETEVDRDMFELQQRRRGPSRSELEEVARVYLEHAQTSPTAAVEAILGYSARTAHRRIKSAEEAGLLPSTTPGKKRLPKATTEKVDPPLQDLKVDGTAFLQDILDERRRTEH